MKRIWSAILLCVAQGAIAGPPFLTDDPEPTETGRWEIYAPVVEVEGTERAFDGSVGVELNYGAAPGLQLTVALPVGFSRDRRTWRFGGGDVEVAVKYRLYHDEVAHVQVAVFPGVALPTAGNGFGNRRVMGLLPVWAQKDMGAWSVFGGGGYAINPGSGNRDYWTGGVAVTRTIGDRVLIGIEGDRQGRDIADGSASTKFGIGAIWKFKAPFRLLASAGPSFDDDGEPASFHSFVALGIDL